MASLLILSDRPPVDLTHGGDLRVASVVRELAKKHNCSLATFGDKQTACLSDLNGIFRSIQLLPVQPEHPPSARRHFRWSNGSSYRLSWPRYYSAVVGKLKAAVKELNVDLLIATSIDVAEFSYPISGVRKVLDDCDCQTLTMEREYKIRRSEMSVRQRLKFLLNLARAISHESRLTRKFNLVTTIGVADQERLRSLNRFRNEEIVVVPNGVSPSFLNDREVSAEVHNSIAFWGALDFQPNLRGVLYFYETVFRPFLSNKDLTWFIIGKNPGRELSEIAERHENIKLTGYIEDLRGLVERIPVMVNPMIMGSGLKNKVLEAFATKRAVISTKLGMEGISAQNGKEFILAETPQQFADGIFRLLGAPREAKLIGECARQLVEREYTWHRAGKQLDSHLTRLLESELLANSFDGITLKDSHRGLGILNQISGVGNIIRQLREIQIRGSMLK